MHQTFSVFQGNCPQHGARSTPFHSKVFGKMTAARIEPTAGFFHAKQRRYVLSQSSLHILKEHHCSTKFFPPTDVPNVFDSFLFSKTCHKNLISAPVFPRIPRRGLNASLRHFFFIGLFSEVCVRHFCVFVLSRLLECKCLK